MSAVNAARGVKLVLKVGNGASPEVFTALCTVNADRGVTFNAQTNDATVPDCDDPDKIAWLAREKQSLSVDFSGGGMLHRQDVVRMWTWLNDEESVNCQVVLDDDLPANVITFTGAFHLTQFDIKGSRGDKAQTTLALSSDGVVAASFGTNVD